MLFPLMNIAVGIFAIYAAIKGTGQAYRSNCPPEVQESVNKMLRKFFWVMGPVMLLFGLTEIIVDVDKYLGGMTFILIECSTIVAAVIAYIVIYRVKYQVELKRQREHEKQVAREQRAQRKSDKASKKKKA